jgi:hypothetical protein
LKISDRQKVIPSVIYGSVNKSLTSKEELYLQRKSTCGKLTIICGKLVIICGKLLEKFSAFIFIFIFIFCYSFPSKKLDVAALRAATLFLKPIVGLRPATFLQWV